MCGFDPVKIDFETDKPGWVRSVSKKFIERNAWALTPPPNYIPTDASTMYVFIDADTHPVNLGHPVYNNFRPDINSLFPNYYNSHSVGSPPCAPSSCVGGVGYYYLDTTQFTNGYHTIAWSITDSAGHTQGIGSRGFQVNNPLPPRIRFSPRAVVSYFLYNDSRPKTYSYCLENPYYPGTCIYGGGARLDPNSLHSLTAGVTAVWAGLDPTDNTSSFFLVTLTADSTAPPGYSSFAATFDGVYSESANNAAYVYDATPQVTSMGEFHSGQGKFVQNQGLVAVRLAGQNLGRCGTLSVSGQGVNIDTSQGGTCGAQSVTRWSPEEVTFYLDIGSSAQGSYTLTLNMTADDANQVVQNNSADPLNVPYASWQFSVVARPTAACPAN